MSGVRFGVQRGWIVGENYDAHLLKRVGYYSTMLQCTPDNFHSIIDGYWFVGVTEHLQRGFDHIAYLLKKDRIILSKKNQTHGNEIFFSNAAIDSFIEMNKLDFDIYNYVKDKFLSYSYE